MIPASRSIACIPHLSAFTEGDGKVVVGWGRKRSGEWARKMAANKGVPWLLMEDGFLRSVEREDAPLSLIVDDEGIYYDAGAPSRLERLIPAPLDEDQAVRARVLMESWKHACVSKYNGAREYEGPLPERFVLVCDQIFGDASITYGQADESSFTRMLQAALTENPECTVLVKTHPDIITGGKRGHFDSSAFAQEARVRFITENCHPVRLIAGAQAVYTVTSQMGFEALIWNRRVRCFGMPFYAGWGLTDDEIPAPARRGHVILEQLVHAALIRYPRYVDPETGKRCEVERALSHVALQRRMRARFPAQVWAIGFSRWKRPILKRFLAGSKVHFVRRGDKVPPRATVALWGQSEPAGLPADAKRLRIEDGFLRSVGLGADLTQPLSWVCDDVGLYYDATRPSELERILHQTTFDAALCSRAEKLREAILAHGLTKYNLSSARSAEPWRRPETDKPVILVPGQVEDDASVRFGAANICTDAALLRAVRAANPGAWIVYKPHPDVVAGLRAKGRKEGSADNYCDETVTDVDMAQLLDAVDAVHVNTSLAGFEALLRGREVTCYGRPFYAGWGLTTDMEPIPRRDRRHELDALVAAALILYPTYVSRVTSLFTTPEQAVSELSVWRAEGGNRGLPMWRKALRPLFAGAKRFSRRCERAPVDTHRSANMEAVHGR